jgi:hypothetical protein
MGVMGGAAPNEVFEKMRGKQRSRKRATRFFMAHRLSNSGANFAVT